MAIAVTKNYETAKPDIERRLQEMLPNAADAGRIERAARLVLKGRERYLAVQRATGVPWDFIGVLHYREKSCNFAGVLHNGEKIIGTGRKTTLVPAGRGPFATWEEAAIDALRIKGLPALKDWSLPRIAFEAERFNGFGYRNKGKPTPYVWSGTNKYLSGKYIADHVYSAAEVDKQLGIMPILLKVRELSRELPDVIPAVKRIGLLRSLITWLKGIAAGLASFFSLDNLTNLREWVGLGSDYFPTAIIAGCLVSAVLLWLLIQASENAELAANTTTETPDE